MLHYVGCGLVNSDLLIGSFTAGAERFRLFPQSMDFESSIRFVQSVSFSIVRGSKNLFTILVVYGVGSARNGARDL